jgi:hypothetical protein
MTDIERRSISEMKEKGFAETYTQTVKDAVKLDWYFSGWEKIVLLICFIWSIYSAFNWIRGFF